MAALVVAALCGTGAVPASADPGDLGGQVLGTVSTDPENPTKLTAGLWSAQLSTAGSDLQFSYERTSRDSTVLFSVTGFPGESSEGFEISAIATDADRTGCGDDDISSPYDAPETVIGADVFVGPSAHGSRDSVCLTSQTIRFVVSRGLHDLAADMDITVAVIEESPLEDPNQELPPVPETDPAFVAPTTGDPVATKGGTSFADAPLLTGGTISSEVAEGEQRFFRVHLDWGQALSAQFDAEPLTEKQLEAAGNRGVDVELVGYNPLRRGKSSAFSENEEEGRVDEGALTLTYGTPPVRYLNRYESMPARVPGDYYISVVAKAPSSRGPVTLPFTLTTQIQGDAVKAPDYLDDQPFLIGPDQRSAVVSGTPRMSSDSESAGWFSTRRIGGIGLGVAGVLFLAFGALRLRN